MTVLYAAHRVVEQITLDRDLMHLRDRLSPEVAEMVYYGFWYTPKMDALLAFIREAQRPVSGEVTLSLYKGNIDVAAAAAPTACTTKESPAWKAGAAITRPMPKAFCASGLARIGSKDASGHANTNPRGSRSARQLIHNRPGGSGPSVEWRSHSLHLAQAIDAQVEIVARTLEHLALVLVVVIANGASDVIGAAFLRWDNRASDRAAFDPGVDAVPRGRLPTRTV